MKVEVFGIEWDTDVDDVCLPDCVGVTVPDELPPEGRMERAIDLASDKVGHCILAIEGVRL